jgi:hypothetical protein
MCMPSRHTGFGEVYFPSLLTQVLVEGEWAVCGLAVSAQGKWPPYLFNRKLSGSHTLSGYSRQQKRHCPWGELNPRSSRPYYSILNTPHSHTHTHTHSRHWLNVVPSRWVSWRFRMSHWRGSESLTSPKLPDFESEWIKTAGHTNTYTLLEWNT